MKKFKTLTTTTSGIATLVVAVVAINLIAAKLFTRCDVTSDEVFSLSDGTVKLLDNVQEDVTVKLYFSRSMKELPRSVAIIGGAATGCQLASILAAFGADVWLLERGDASLIRRTS